MMLCSRPQATLVCLNSTPLRLSSTPLRLSSWMRRWIVASIFPVALFAQTPEQAGDSEGSGSGKGRRRHVTVSSSL